MAELQGEGGFLVRKPELLRARKGLGHLPGRRPRPHAADGVIEVVAAALVRVDQPRGGAADGEGPVIAGAIAVVGVEDVEEDRVARAHHPIAIDMWMRMGALARNGVHALNVLGAEVIQGLGDQPDAFVLFHARAHHLVQRFIG